MEKETRNKRKTNKKENKGGKGAPLWNSPVRPPFSSWPTNSAPILLPLLPHLFWGIKGDRLGGNGKIMRRHRAD